MSCQDSHVYIYNGVPQGSSSAPSEFKLLASVCGYNPKTVGAIASDLNELTVMYEGAKPSGDKRFVVDFSVFACASNCPGNRICQSRGVLGSRCVCKAGWEGALCDTPQCPDNCSDASGQGFCDLVSFVFVNYQQKIR